VTQYIGLIGYPLKHSISPDFQQAALDYCKLDIRYKTWEVRARDLASTINRLREPQNLGANVTVHCKEAVVPLLDGHDDFSTLVGAVNTIVNRAGRLEGFNTDGIGFLKALREDAGFEAANKRAVILGAGGAARAITFSLLNEKVSRITIANRSLSRAKNLTDALIKWAVLQKIETKITAVPLSSSNFIRAISACELLVNCTTVGMKYSSGEGQTPLAPSLIPKGALIYDLVYNPLTTPLLRAAQTAGAETIGGLPMLVYQGAASFKLWTGREAPLDIMLSAARKILDKLEGDLCRN
jgi:shikimate dehydrogenase